MRAPCSSELNAGGCRPGGTGASARSTTDLSQSGSTCARAYASSTKFLPSFADQSADRAPRTRRPLLARHARPPRNLRPRARHRPPSLPRRGPRPGTSPRRGRPPPPCAAALARVLRLPAALPRRPPRRVGTLPRLSLRAHPARLARGRPRARDRRLVPARRRRHHRRTRGRSPRSFSNAETRRNAEVLHRLRGAGSHSPRKSRFVWGCHAPPGAATWRGAGRRLCKGPLREGGRLDAGRVRQKTHIRTWRGSNPWREAMRLPPRSAKPPRFFPNEEKRCAIRPTRLLRGVKECVG